MNLKEAICKSLKNHNVNMKCSEKLLNLEIDKLILDEYKSEINLIGLSNAFFTPLEKKELKNILKKYFQNKKIKFNIRFKTNLLQNKEETFQVLLSKLVDFGLPVYGILNDCNLNDDGTIATIGVKYINGIFSKEVYTAKITQAFNELFGISPKIEFVQQKKENPQLQNSHNMLNESTLHINKEDTFNKNILQSSQTSNNNFNISLNTHFSSNNVKEDIMSVAEALKLALDSKMSLK
ncbi:MAG: hypothetical protein ACI4PK_00520, partial [Oscillospiraceae bacterium]